MDRRPPLRAASGSEFSGAVAACAPSDEALRQLARALGRQAAREDVCAAGMAREGARFNERAEGVDPPPQTRGPLS